MVAFISSLAVLALAVPALALPAHNGTVALSKRQIKDVKNASCRGAPFFQNWHIQAAAQEVLNHLIAGNAVGNGNSWYPHQYYNREGFTWQSGCGTTWWEFPIMVYKTAYGGGNPREHRVVIGSVDKSKNEAVLCGVITHLYTTDPNGFTQCNLYT